MNNIAHAVSSVPADVLDASGAVFYSAPPAFVGHRRMYILGLNPGGNPEVQAKNPVRWPANYDRRELGRLLFGFSAPLPAFE